MPPNTEGNRRWIRIKSHRTCCLLQSEPDLRFSPFRSALSGPHTGYPSPQTESDFPRRLRQERPETDPDIPSAPVQNSLQKHFGQVHGAGAACQPLKEGFLSVPVWYCTSSETSLIQIPVVKIHIRIETVQDLVVINLGVFQSVGNVPFVFGCTAKTFFQLCHQIICINPAMRTNPIHQEGLNGNIFSCPLSDITADTGFNVQLMLQPSMSTRRRKSTSTSAPVSGRTSSEIESRHLTEGTCDRMLQQPKERYRQYDEEAKMQSGSFKNPTGIFGYLWDFAWCAWHGQSLGGESPMLLGPYAVDVAVTR